PGIRWESGVETGSAVTIHYDPMLAKVIAHAPTRAEAAQRLARALAAARVHGVRTNVPLLLEVLRHPEFVAGRFDTHFVGTQVVPDRPPTAAEREADRVHAVAVALWQQERRRAEAPVLRGIPSGWRNNPSQPQEVGVAKGEVLVVLEAMKMEHEVAAPHDGVVRAVPVEPGQQVNAGDVLVILDEQREEASA